jgi:hypothetical protein
MKFEFLTLDYEPCPDGEMPARFGFECPKRSDGFICSGLLIRGQGHDIPNKTWTWDGNRDAPTFIPSINCTHCSHGYITAGVWRDA